MKLIRCFQGCFSLKQVMNLLYSENENAHGISQEETIELQNALIDVLSEIMDVCNKYDIRPFLQGGTLLGKIRHNGFIPWDDDLDLGMSRRDYERFKGVFEKELADRYILKVPNSPYGTSNRFMQIFRKGTTYITVGANDDIPQNIYIDIFPIDYVPENAIACQLKGWRSNFLMIMASCAEFRQHMSPSLQRLMLSNKQGRINYHVRMFLGWLVSFRSLNQWFDAVDSCICREKESALCTSATGRKHYLGEIVDSNVFFPLKKTEFCGIPTWTLNDPDGYLRNLYGSTYMEIPPEEKREHHFIEKLDISTLEHRHSVK